MVRFLSAWTANIGENRFSPGSASGEYTSFPLDVIEPYDNGF